MKRNFKHNLKIQFRLSYLALSVFSLSMSSYALQPLDENALRAVNAQDGLYLETSYGEITFDNLYWEDKAGAGLASNGEKSLRAYAENVKISGNDLGTKYEIQAGSSATGKAGLDLKIESHHSLIEVDNLNICAASGCITAGEDKNVSLGKMAIQSTSPISAHFTTRDGLFNSTSLASLELGIKNTSIYLGQQTNQLVLKNFNFNFIGQGFIKIDEVEGFKLDTGTAGFVDFTRVIDPLSGSFANNDGTYGSGNNTTNSGLNIELMLKQNVNPLSSYDINDLYGANINQSQNAKGLIRVGANGRIVNGFLQLRGIDTAGTNNPSDYGINGSNILGFANSALTPNAATNTVMGSTGIGFRMKGEFTTDNDAMLSSSTDRPLGNATTLEIGGAGLNTYGFEFGNLTDLAGSGRGLFDSGNVYINLVDTKTVLMPYNYVFQNSRFGDGSTLTTSSDYVQNIHNGTTTQNPYALVATVRGAEFQAFARRGRFTNSAGVDVGNRITETPATGTGSNQWGLALPFYNLNANLAIFGMEMPLDSQAKYYSLNSGGNIIAHDVSGGAQRLGFSLGMSTDGIDRTTGATQDPIGKKTTSILVLDGENNYYMGLRNVDMLLKGAGSIGLENGSLNVSLPDLLIVMAGDIAAGNLPTSLDTNCIIDCTTFAKNDDVLFGLKLRLGGKMDFSLIPNSSIDSGSRLSVVGELDMPSTMRGNTIQISDPINGSILGFDNIVGKVAFNNAIVIDKDRRVGSVTENEGQVSFNMGLRFNPQAEKGCYGSNAQKCIDGVLRVKDINFYPPLRADGIGDAGRRLGEMAITGGTLNGSFGIIPRNGSFSF